VLKFCNFVQSFSIRKYRDTIIEDPGMPKKEINDKKTKSSNWKICKGYKRNKIKLKDKNDKFGPASKIR
jgi:hypothetical protein